MWYRVLGCCVRGAFHKAFLVRTTPFGSGHMRALRSKYPLRNLLGLDHVTISAL